MAERKHHRRSTDRAYRQTDALLQALSRVELQYASGSDPEKLFHELLSSLLTLTGSAYGFIGEVTAGPAGATILQPCAMANLTEAELDPAPLLNAILGTQQPVVRDLLPRNNEQLPEGPEIKSLWLLPIHCREALVGVAGVSDYQRGHTAGLAAYLKPFLIMCGILIEGLRNDRERWQVAESLRESDERFRIMADTAPVLIWMAGLDKGCTYFNRGWLEFTGRPLEKELGDGWAEGVHRDDIDRCLEIYTTAFDARQGFRMEYRLRRHDGDYRWFLDHGVPRFALEGNFLGYIGCCIDITDRKQAEGALEEGRAFLRQVIDVDPNFIFAKDREGRFVLANQAVADAYGTTVEQLIGKTDADFNRNAEEVEFFRRKDLETMDTLREQFIPEERVTDANGRVRWMQTIKRPIIGKDGTAHQMLGSATDITERKRMELEALRQRNELTHLSRMTLLGELSGSLAHELNQPLTAILANAQAAQRFLAGDEPDVEQVREILQDIVRDDERAGEVIQRLREMLRKGQLRRQPLDVNVHVVETLKLVHSDLIIRGVAVSTDLEPELPLVMADRVQLQQVMLNLMVNGADAMSGAGDHRKTLLIRTEREGADSVRVSVLDEGPGISAEAMGQLFEPFYTTKTNGLGLGLSICHSIITSHGGKLWAVNNAGGGAIFYFSLPAYREPPS
jgi:two-component system sensor kinase FixL